MAQNTSPYSPSGDAVVVTESFIMVEALLLIWGVVHFWPVNAEKVRRFSLVYLEFWVKSIHVC